MSLDIAYRELLRLIRLIDELVDAERLRTGVLHLNRQQMDVASVLKRAIETVQPLAKGQCVQLAADGDRLLVDGDADRLQQVFLNLLTNAIAYAPGTDRIDVRIRQLDGQVQVQVQDYGPGIPPAELRKVFERFYRASNGGPSEGMGLGLFIASQIVAAHGGSIDAATAEGSGTTFTVRLPLAPNDQVKATE